MVDLTALVIVPWVGEKRFPAIDKVPAPVNNNVLLVPMPVISPDIVKLPVPIETLRPAPLPLAVKLILAVVTEPSPTFKILFPLFIV